MFLNKSCELARSLVFNEIRTMSSNIPYYQHVPREPSGAKGEPLTVKVLHETGNRNFEQTKVLDYASLTPADVGITGKPDSYKTIDQAVNS